MTSDILYQHPAQAVCSLLSLYFLLPIWTRQRCSWQTETRSCTKGLVHQDSSSPLMHTCFSLWMQRLRILHAIKGSSSLLLTAEKALGLEVRSFLHLAQRNSAWEYSYPGTHPCSPSAPMDTSLTPLLAMKSRALFTLLILCTRIFPRSGLGNRSPGKTDRQVMRVFTAAQDTPAFHTG